MEVLKALIFSVVFFVGVDSHGLMQKPPSRSTVWRHIDEPLIAPFVSLITDDAKNWNDNELFCGGAQYQQSHGGKCGICGDPYAGEKKNEAGGQYALGIITGHYDQGTIMTATVKLTAHHMGYFEFRLCVHNDQTTPATEECFKDNLLKQVDGSTRYFPDKSSNPWIYDVKLQLPSHITCTQCILQWRYHAENTWNCDENNNCCTGCGPQEEFYNCADITIGPGPVPDPPGWNGAPSVTTTPAKPTTTTPGPTPETDKPTTTTPGTTTTTTPGEPVEGFTCEGRNEGQYKKDCTTFFTCTSNGSGPFEYPCPPGTVYDEIREMCDYPHNVPPECGTKGTAR